MLVLSQWCGTGLRFCISNKLPYDVSETGLLMTPGAVNVGCTLKPNGETGSGVRFGHEEISPHNQDHWLICPLLATRWEQCLYRNGNTSHLSRTLLNLALTCHSLLSMVLWLLHFPVGLRMPEETLFRGIPVEPPCCQLFRGFLLRERHKDNPEYPMCPTAGKANAEREWSSMTEGISIR